MPQETGQKTASNLTSRVFNMKNKRSCLLQKLQGPPLTRPSTYLKNLKIFFLGPPQGDLLPFRIADEMTRKPQQGQSALSRSPSADHHLPAFMAKICTIHSILRKKAHMSARHL